MTIHKDYPDQDFTRLRYNDILSLIIRRGQSHLDPHTDFASTWLYLIAFRHCIKNLSSSAPKYSELLVSHYGDLRTEGYLYPCISWAALDSRTLSRWVTSSVMMYPYISPYAIPVSSHSWVKRTTNPYSIQRPSLDKRYHPVMIYHLITNMFNNYMINSSLSILT